MKDTLSSHSGTPCPVTPAEKKWTRLNFAPGCRKLLIWFTFWWASRIWSQKLPISCQSQAICHQKRAFFPVFRLTMLFCDMFNSIATTWVGICQIWARILDVTPISSQKTNFQKISCPYGEKRFFKLKRRIRSDSTGCLLSKIKNVILVSSASPYECRAKKTIKTGAFIMGGRFISSLSLNWYQQLWSLCHKMISTVPISKLNHIIYATPFLCL